jgi:hypothetical protein
MKDGGEILGVATTGCATVPLTTTKLDVTFVRRQIESGSAEKEGS